MQESLTELIELLSIVIEEKLEWENMQDLDPVYANLFHYWDDEDIREKDEDYRSLQDSEMIKLIDHLKNKDIEQACNISFLKATSNS